MKKPAFLSLIIILTLSTCGEYDKDSSKNGTIWGYVLYEGAKDKQVDGVLITMQKQGEEEIYSSPQTSNDGRYEISDLPYGRYTMTASGWGMEKQERSISIPCSNPHYIHMTQTVIKPQIYQNGELIGDYFDMSETPTLNFDILNANRGTMIWNVSKSSDNWVAVSPEKGEIAQGEQNYAFTIHIDRDKLECGAPPATISINSNKGSKTIKLTSTKPGCVGKAQVAIIEQTDEKIILKASAVGANSYIWYYGNSKIADNSGDIYSVTQSGIYYAEGESITGMVGEKSEGVYAEIKSITKPQKAVISGNNKNLAPFEEVTLSATSNGATYFKWYKDGKSTGSINNTLRVTSSGSYSVEGCNAKGTGERSEAFLVTIIPCPATPTISADKLTNSCPETSVKLTAYSKNATSYEWYRGKQLLNETSAVCFASESGTYFVYGVNEAGKSNQSNFKNVVITSCNPDKPSGVSARMSDKGITISWDDPYSSSIEHQIEVCDNPMMDDNVKSIYVGSYRDSIEIEDNMLFCGVNYFRVTAIRDGNFESEGVVISINRNITISPPSLSISMYGSLSWVYSRVKGSTATIYYDIFQKIGNSSWQKIEEKITNTFYSPSYEPEFGETVYYQIRSYIETECGIYENFSGVVRR
ncbi:MAG: carboxypeptidase-like regulatory domain-containing protein [Alistipes senegalensis]|nr:carboxypeptidase-like regulatory domain-containing protein [Bacteroides cellulosilyticus]MCM1351728.1 carboxypeptidase-like regulatory domain-containing protein [Alistipes senegalensis]